MSIYTSWPSLTADKLHFDTKQFINDLALASLDPNFDGKIKGDGTLSQKSINDLKLDPVVFNNVTDGRFSLGLVLSSVYAEYLPRLQARREIGAAGGCQIINSYICDADGVPIIKASSNCPPNVNANKITGGEVVDMIFNLYTKTQKEHSDNFLNYLKTKYSGWTVQLVLYTFANFFIIILNKTDEKTTYIKYFFDQANYIASQLEISLTIVDGLKMTASTAVNQDMMDVMTSPILNYADPNNPTSPPSPTSATLDQRTINNLSSVLVQPLSSYSFINKYLPGQSKVVSPVPQTNILPNTIVL